MNSGIQVGSERAQGFGQVEGRGAWQREDSIRGIPYLIFFLGKQAPRGPCRVCGCGGTLSPELTATQPAGRRIQMREWRPREAECLEPAGTASPDSGGLTPEP